MEYLSFGPCVTGVGNVSPLLCETIKIKVGTNLTVSSTLFSKNPRRKNSIKKITITNATKCLDYFLDGTAVLYASTQQKKAYLEFTAVNELYHIWIEKDFNNNCYVAKMPEISFDTFYNSVESNSLKTLFFTAINYLENMKLSHYLQDFQAGNHTEDLILKYTDEFWFGFNYLEGIFPIKTNCNINKEVKTAFENQIWEPKIGTSKSAFEAYSKKSKIKKDDSKISEYKKLYDDIKSGKYLLDYDWTNSGWTQKDLALYVKPLSFLDNYIPDKYFWKAFKVFQTRLSRSLNEIKKAEEKNLPYPDLSKKNALNISLHGTAGTGKSYLLYALSAAFGLPTPFNNCSGGTEEDDYEGINKVIKGELEEVETTTMKVIKNGGIIIEEEFDLPDPAVNKGVFNQITEFPYIAMEGGYKPIKRHPLSVVAITFNVGDQSGQMDPALASRFTPSIRFTDPDESDFLNRLIISGAKKETATFVYHKYQRILELLKDPDVNGEECLEYIVPRLCLDACNLIDNDGYNSAEAIEDCFIGKIAELRPDIADAIWTIIQFE